jgi:predicted aspartyl protease
MGRVMVDVVVSNGLDVTDVERGRLTPDKVRQVTIKAVADTGATRLILPESVARQLGLPTGGRMRVRLADGSIVVKELVKYAHLQYAGRSGLFTAIAEPNRSDALLGAIVMEDLDLIVDCPTETLRPRDPTHLTAEA